MTPRENPTCSDVSERLGDDFSRAIAYRESTWAQFNKKGETLIAGGDHGLMQLNRMWKGKNIPRTDPVEAIDWDRALTDWQYNVDIGKKLIENEYKVVARQGLINLEVENPTETQLFLNTYARYNGGTNYFKRNADGDLVPKLNCETCRNAEIVLQRLEQKPWESQTGLRCQR